MKRITKEELPQILNAETIEKLIEMALEFPKTTFDWAEVSELLEERNQLMFILDKVEERKKAIEKAKEDAKSEEQKLKEKQDWENFVKNADPKGFYGNMGEPVGVYDYKGKYGLWPWGIDDSIAPLDLSKKLTQSQITKIANLYLQYRKGVQWKEVYSALKKLNYDFSIIFNRAYEINNKIFPMEDDIEEFREKYGVYPPNKNGS